MVTELATLTVAEADCLADCEQRIERGLKTFVEVGTSLATIRDNLLYRAEHGTFEDYVEARWQLSRAHAYRMITAAAVVSPIGDTELPMPSTESQARELARVPEQERTEVWRATVEDTDGKPTAAAIRSAYERTQTPAPSPEPGPASTSAGPGHNLPEPSSDDDLAAGRTQRYDSVEEMDAALDAAAPTFGEVLDHLVPDSNPYREWQGNFLKAIGGVNRLMLFAPADVAEKADEQCVEELVRVADRLATWRAEVMQARKAAIPHNVTPIRRIS